MKIRPVQRGFFLVLMTAGLKLWAGSSAGSTSMPFLTTGAGARALGMGEAATASASDATVLYWNPGALLRVESQSATFMHATAVENSFFDYASYVHHRGNSAYGVGLQYFSAGSVDQTDISGNKTGSLSPHDYALTGGYARKVWETGIGVSMKYVRSTLVDSAQTLALDGGVLSPVFFNERIRAGASFANVGGKVTYDNESSSLPSLFRAGIEIRPWKGWTGAADVVAPKGEDHHLALGGEYCRGLGKELTLSLRGGYNTRRSAKEQPGELSAGLGFGWSRLQVDYAFVSRGDLDPSQVVSIGYEFRGDQK